MSRHWMVAATLLLLAGSIACSGNPEARKQRSFETANQYVQQNKLREAVIEYRNAIQIDDKLAAAVHHHLRRVDL